MYIEGIAKLQVIMEAMTSTMNYHRAVMDEIRLSDDHDRNQQVMYHLEKMKTAEEIYTNAVCEFDRIQKQVS